MTASAPSEAEIIREMSEIVGRDLKPRPAVYWSDLLVSTAVAYAATAGFLWAPQLGLSAVAQAGLGVVAGLALFRLGTFIHEIQHLRRGELARFKTVWNLAYGIPFLMPSFMYANHSDHHVGRIDEVRLSSVARSRSWLAATHDFVAQDRLTYGAAEPLAN